MTEYLKSGPFSVNMAGDKKYRDNFDAIDWGKKCSQPASSDSLQESSQPPGDSPCSEEPIPDTEPDGQLWMCDGTLFNTPGTIQQQVFEFHVHYGQPVVAVPTVPDAERVRLRLKLITEELLELLEACGADLDQVFVSECRLLEAIASVDATRVDVVEVADALGDIAYVTEGACLEFGINSQAVLAEIHRANMSKLGADGLPVYNSDGKVTKGPNYVAPDLKKVLKLD